MFIFLWTYNYIIFIYEIKGSDFMKDNDIFEYKLDLKKNNMNEILEYMDNCFNLFDLLKGITFVIYE